MTLIICLCGKKQSGKNTIANYIMSRFLYNTKQIGNFDIDDTGTIKTDRATIIDSNFLNNHKFKDIGVYSFAYYLKKFCVNVFGLKTQQCFGTECQKDTLVNFRWDSMPIYAKDLIKQSQMTAREFMQFFGTEIVRSINPNAWVNATINRIKKENKKIAIITDGRFPNEIRCVKKFGGKIIKLTKNENETKDVHSSEVGLKNFGDWNFDCVIQNSNMTIVQQNTEINRYLCQWFEEYGI